MLRDNLVGLIEPMLSSAGANPLALCTARKKSSDDRPPCLENPRPEGAESTLTENAPSPFHAEPKQSQLPSDGSIAWNHVTVSPNLAGELPERCAVESLLRCSRDSFLAAPRTDQCGGTAREIPLLGRNQSGKSKILASVPPRIRLCVRAGTSQASNRARY